MSLIAIKDLTFGYSGTPESVFENVSCEFDSDWRLGLVGRNGKGKTTLLRLLKGDFEYRGSIYSAEKMEYFPYLPADFSGTAAEAAYAVCEQAEWWELEREISLLGADPDILTRDYSALSGGEKTKLQIAAMFLRENSFLLLDEPTNHLDTEARGALARYLRKKRGFIAVSHDRGFLDECTDHTLAFSRTSIEVVRGSFSVWWENRERRLQDEQSRNQKLMGEIKRLKQSSRRKSDWSKTAEHAKYEETASPSKDKGYIGHKAAKTMKSSKVLEARTDRAIEEKSALLKDLEREFPLKMRPLKYMKETLVEARELTPVFSGREICEKVSFTVNRGDRVCLSGINGSGKTSILRIILGEDVNYSGEIHVGSGLKISRLSQDDHDLKGTIKELPADNGIDPALFFAVLTKLDFTPELFGRDVSALSQGQRKKLMLAVSLMSEAHLYIWDEPLNYIDIFTRMQVERLILEYCPTLIFVEHDMSFCEKITTKTVEIRKLVEK